jgi:hypothetical protein
MDDDEREAIRAEGLDPDNPAVVAALDFVRSEMELVATSTLRVMAKQEVIEQARARLEQAGQMLNEPPDRTGLASALALCGIYELLIEWADNFGESEDSVR